SAGAFSTMTVRRVSPRCCRCSKTSISNLWLQMTATISLHPHDPKLDIAARERGLYRRQHVLLSLHCRRSGTEANAPELAFRHAIKRHVLDRMSQNFDIVR